MRWRRSTTIPRSASTGIHPTFCGSTSTSEASSGISGAESSTWTAKIRSFSLTVGMVSSAHTCLGAILAEASISCLWVGVTCLGSPPATTETVIGYKGPISVEWEDAGMDRNEGAKASLDFLRGWIRGVVRTPLRCRLRRFQARRFQAISHPTPSYARPRRGSTWIVISRPSNRSPAPSDRNALPEWPKP